MAQDKHQSDQHYIEEELAQAQQDTNYGDSSNIPAEQSSSPESMKASRPTSHKGRKSQSKGYQG